mmetsp:Transcript_32071/g.47365  ORF Transcript_32071/g.47365 Transcript_32071/m.47365 type:complete len:186 (+) Transcript_32071:84-641(+)
MTIKEVNKEEPDIVVDGVIPAESNDLFAVAVPIDNDADYTYPAASAPTEGLIQPAQGTIGENLHKGMGSKIHETATIGDNCKLSMGCRIGKNVRIGHNCKLGLGASVDDFVTIGNNCKFDKGTRVKQRAVIGNGVHMQSGSVVESGVVVEERVTIYAGQHFKGAAVADRFNNKKDARTLPFKCNN